MSEADHTAPDLEPAPYPMSLEDARRRIREKAQLIVDEHDPIMLSVILHQGFIADYDKMLKAHEATLSAAVENRFQESAANVEEILKTLKDEALKGSLENVLAGVQTHAREAERTYQKTLSLRRATIALTALQWAAVAAFFFILK